MLRRLDFLLTVSRDIFKILLVAFAGMIFIHAVAFFMRSFQELREGQSSENKYKDLDELPDLTEAVKTEN